MVGVLGLPGVGHAEIGERECLPSAPEALDPLAFELDDHPPRRLEMMLVDELDDPGMVVIKAGRMKAGIDPAREPLPYPLGIVCGDRVVRIIKQLNICGGAPPRGKMAGRASATTGAAMPSKPHGRRGVPAVAEQMR